MVTGLRRRPGGGKRLLLFLLLAPLLLLAAACNYNLGVENSWMRVQNVGAQPANVEVQYFGPNGEVYASEVSPPIQPGAGWTFAQIMNPSLPKGFLGSAVLVSDQPLAVLMGKDSDRGGGFFHAAGDTIAMSAGSGRLYLPLVINRDGFAQDWSARFTVQNTGGTTACVTLVYMSNADDAEVHWDPYNPTTANPTRQSGCPKGGLPIPPNGSIFRSWYSMGVGPGFTGSVRVDLHENAEKVPPSQQFIVASTDVWNSTTHRFANYRGLTESEMGNSLLLPLVEREAGNEWSTDFEIVNADPSQPANVTLEFSGWDGSQNPPQFVTRANTFSVRASRICFQNSDWANCLAPGDTLPHNFSDGVARISSSKPVGVIVSRSSTLREAYSNYRAVKTESATQRVYLPLVAKNSLTAFWRLGWHSWIRVITTDGGPANLTVRYFGDTLPGGQASYSTSMYRSVTLVQAWEGILPDGFFGSAIIESDRPIVALGNVVTSGYPGDPDFMYNAVPSP